MKITVISLISILVIISNLQSEEIPYGQEFQVSTNVIECKFNPCVEALPDGGFVACWDNSDGYVEEWNYKWDIGGQTFDSTCAKKGSEFQINIDSYRWANYPKIAKLKDGGYVICWEYRDFGGDTKIMGQIFDAAGKKRGTIFQINTTTSGEQIWPAVTDFDNGEFVVTWLNRSSGIIGQKFESMGAKKENEFIINTTVQQYQAYPCVTNLLDGGFVVCWTNVNKNPDIYGQIFDADGIKVGFEFKVNSSTKYPESGSSVAGLKGGDFVVCWVSGRYIYTQMFTSKGVIKNNEFQVNPNIPIWFYEFDNERTIAALDNGGFVVCWFKDEKDIFCQIFDDKGDKKGNTFQVNIKTKAYPRHRHPSVTGLVNGGFVICWESIRPYDSKYIILGKCFSAKPLIYQLKNFSLIEPLYDSTLKTTRPIFKWQQPGNIIECYPWELTFNLHIDTNPNFSDPLIIKNIEDTTYTIDSLAAGKTYFWKVLAKNLAGDSLWSTQQDWGFFIKPGATLVENTENELPQDFQLFQNYPNPFNSRTEIKYSLSSGSNGYQVQLKVYDILGRLVKVLVDQEQVAGTYSISWDGADQNGNSVPSGVYFYTLEVNTFRSIRKMLLIQ